MCECHYEFAAAKVGLRSHSSFHFMPAAKRHSTGTDTHICSDKCDAMKFYSCLLNSFKELQNISPSYKGFLTLNSINVNHQHSGTGIFENT